jgi:uncharacterized damage-inducible protein DinB
MKPSDPLDILLQHDLWATEQILDACAKRSDEQFHQRFEIGRGSLHDTLTHMLAAMRTWTETLQGKEPGPRIDADGKRRSSAELRSILESWARDFASEARRRPLDEIVTRVREGKMYEYTRGVVVMQVTTHGMHHRAQCLNMLRHLGVKPLPPSSVAEWSWVAG